MGKAIVVELSPHGKYVRWAYQSAYSELRQFYRTCKLNRFTDSELMEYKYRLWLKHGKYLDLAWQHHFASKVGHISGVGNWHGWRNIRRYYEFVGKHPDPLHYGPNALPF
jgi:hypothetical protein